MATYEYTVKGLYWIGSISCTSRDVGTYGVTNTVASRVVGQHRTGQQTWLTEAKGKFAVLNRANTKSRGTFGIVNSFPKAWSPASGAPKPSPIARKGSYGVVNGKTSRVQGKYRVGSLPVLVTRRGLYNVGSTLFSSVKGLYRVGSVSISYKDRGLYRLAYTTYLPTRKGKHRLAYVTYLPIDKGAFGVTNTLPRSNKGTYAVANTIGPSIPVGGVGGARRVGIYRVQGTAGYNCYIGEDKLPDFNSPPAAFSATLPFNVAMALPSAGTKLVYVVVRKVNSYGLESQNVKPQIIRLSAGGPLLAPLQAPQGLLVVPTGAGAVTILSKYLGHASDAAPATLWKVWLSQTLIDITDAPTFTQAVAGENLKHDLAGLASGTWNIALALFRASDSNQSPLLEDTFDVPTTPPEPVPVAGGYSIPD